MGRFGPTVIDESHKRYISSCAAAFIVRPTEIAKRLGMQKYGDEFGFEPVKIGNERIRQLLLEIPKRTLDSLRRSYLADFSKTPLAHKKFRIEELTRLYKQVDSLTQLRIGRSKTEDGYTVSSVSQSVKLDKKLAILKQIRDEVGEDVDKLADALRDSKATVNVNLGSAFINEIVYALQGQLPAKGNGNGSGLPILDPANEVKPS